MTQSFTITVHYKGLHGKAFLQQYIKEAVRAWKNGYHPDDERRAIQKVTFSKDSKMKHKQFWMDKQKELDGGKCIIFEAHLEKPADWDTDFDPANSVHVVASPTATNPIKFRRIKNDDLKRGHKAGDIVIINNDYYMAPDKVICVATLNARNDHSLDARNLEPVTPEDIAQLIKEK